MTSRKKRKVILAFAYEECESVDKALWAAQLNTTTIGSRKIFVLEGEIPWPKNKDNILSPYNEEVISFLEKHGFCSVENISKAIDIPADKVKKAINYLKRFKRIKERKGLYKLLF